MPIFWLVIFGRCLYFIIGRGRSGRAWLPGRGFGDATALDILKKR
jgi:hypothetical protein